MLRPVTQASMSKSDMECGMFCGLRGLRGAEVDVPPSPYTCIVPVTVSPATMPVDEAVEPLAMTRMFTEGGMVERAGQINVQQRHPRRRDIGLLCHPVPLLMSAEDCPAVIPADAASSYLSLMVSSALITSSSRPRVRKYRP